MNEIITIANHNLTIETALSIERTRLVRLCAAITGNAEAAEDLAQETLLEAWRHLNELRDRERFPQWLSGIARNVCLRWARKRGQDSARLVELRADLDENFLEDSLADDFDLEVELERKELVELLDRALALLPADTRTILIKRYVEESPLSEVAEQMGLQTSAVTMRLQRGKLALRRVLLDRLSHEIAPYRLSVPDEWEVTRFWCSFCGRSHARGRFSPDKALLLLECPGCGASSSTYLHGTSEQDLFRGVKGYKPAITRLHNWVNRYYYPNLKNALVPCVKCGHPMPLKQAPSEDIPDQYRDRRGFYHICPSCSGDFWVSLDFMALSLPEGQRFWRDHPRMHLLPEQAAEIDGRFALLTRFESLDSSAKLTIISARDTYDVLRIQEQGR